MRLPNPDLSSYLLFIGIQSRLQSFGDLPLFRHAMVPYGLSVKSVRRIVSHTAVCGDTLIRFTQHPIRAHVHVLRQPGTATSVLSDPFPERKEEIRAVFVLK